MRVILLFLLTFLSIDCLSQTRVHYSESPQRLNKKLDQWHEGEITLVGGTAIEAAFAINPMVEGGLLKVKDGKKLITLTPYDIENFSFIDKEQDRRRYFESLDVSDDQQALVEIIYRNEDFELHGIESVQTAYTYYIDNGSRWSFSSNKFYMFFKMGGEYMRFSRKVFWNLVYQKEDELKTFKKENNLYLSSPAHISSLLNYYDLLINEEN